MSTYSHPATLTFNGSEYSFAHLAPLTVTFNLLGEEKLPAEIRFKSHCYTRPLYQGERAHNLVRHDDENKNERYFCPDRYQLSQKIESWLSAWCHQPCIMGKNYKHGIEHWIVVEDDQQQKIKVAFSIEKHRDMDLGLFIWIKTTHAYDTSSPPEASRDNSYPFNTLAKTVAYTGKQPATKHKGAGNAGGRSRRR